jgi:hypothetical protein
MKPSRDQVKTRSRSAPSGSLGRVIHQRRSRGGRPTFRGSFGLRLLPPRRACKEGVDAPRAKPGPLLSPACTRALDREVSSSSGSAGSPPSEASRGIEHGEESSDVPEPSDRHILNKMGRSLIGTTVA